jgi:hypothetical protein
VSRVRIELDGVHVTPWVVTEDWPEWLETSVKGPGWFEWSVKAFSFRLHESAPVVPTYGLACRVLMDGVERFTGVVDGIKDAFSKAPELTIQPPAVTLKDIKAGTPEYENGAIAYAFTIPSPGLLVGEAAALVLAGYDANRDPRTQPVGEWVVSTLGDDEPLMEIYAPRGTVGPTIAESGGVVPYSFPVINQVPDGFELSDLTNESNWLRLARNSAGEVRIYVYSPTFLYNQTEGPENQVQHDFGYTEPFAGLPDPFCVPYVYDTWTPGYGGTLATISMAEWSVLSTVGWESSRINADMVIQFVRSQLGLPRSYAIYPVGAFDLDMDGKRMAWGFVEVLRNIVAVIWTEPTIDRISGKWKNASMSTLLKDFALVTGNWMKVEGNQVTYVRRDTVANTVTLPSFGLALENEQQSEMGTPGSISLEIRDPSDPDSTGIDIPRTLLTALDWWYSSRFSGVTVQTTAEWPIALIPGDITLLSGTDYGQVIELDWSTDGQRFRVKTVQEGT